MLPQLPLTETRNHASRDIDHRSTAEILHPEDYKSKVNRKFEISDQKLVCLTEPRQTLLTVIFGIIGKIVPNSFAHELANRYLAAYVGFTPI